MHDRTMFNHSMFDDKRLAIIDLETGELTPLADWLQQQRREELRLRLVRLGRGRYFVDEGEDELARAFFAPKENLQ